MSFENGNPEDTHSRVFYEFLESGDLVGVIKSLDEGADENKQFHYWGMRPSALCVAIDSEHKDIVSALLDRGAEVNLVSGSQYGNALCTAANTNNKEIVSLLLHRGADINWVGTRDYGTALCIAVFNGYTEIVSLLLDGGADVNLVGANNIGTALCAGSHGDNIDIVSLLLGRGADVNLGVGLFGSALGAAAAWGNKEIVSLLLDKGADVNLSGPGPYGTALSAAARYGHEEAVSLLLDKGAKINLMGAGEHGTALCTAAMSGKKYIVRLLLSRGANADLVGSTKYGTALSTAAWYGDEFVVWELLKRGADVNIVGVGDHGTALCAAVSGGKIQIVSQLLIMRADVNLIGTGKYGSALCTAAHKGNEDIVSLLLDKGAKVNLVGAGEYGTALCTAAEAQKENIVSLLLDRGANVNLVGTNKYGTALCIAASVGNTKIVSRLLDQNAEVNLVGIGEYGSVLCAAACVGQTRVVLLLLERGADVNLVGWKYGTALGTAVYFGNIEIVEFLLNNGADASGVGGHYKTISGVYPNALDAASSEGSKANQAIFALLNRAGAFTKDAQSTLTSSVATHSEVDMAELIDRAPFPMPYTYDIFSAGARLPQRHQELEDPISKSARGAAIETLASPGTIFGKGDRITPEQADVLCEELESIVLLRLLLGLTGLPPDPTEPVEGWLQNDIKYFLERKFDFGTAYAAARVAWKHFNEYDPRQDQLDDRISTQRAHWRWEAKKLDKARSAAIKMEGLQVIDSPYSVMPRRIWDVKCHRVIDFRMLHSAHLTTLHLASTDPGAGPRHPVFWAITHSWTADFQSIETSIHHYQWPVPLPRDIDLDLQLRSELLGYGAEYVWLDALCLRQHSTNDELNQIKEEEWKLDVPTIGNIYRAADRIVRYFNGLGREFSHDGWDNDRHWLKRAWTLQEIRTEHTTINGGVPRNKLHVLMNTRTTINKIDNATHQVVKVETTLRRAMRPVLLLASEADSPRGCRMYELAKEMADRKASTPLDRVSGLLYLLRLTRLPCYTVGVGPEEFWTACFGLLPPERELEVLFEYPYRGSRKEWFPTWEQIMSWPEKDPDYEHIHIEWSQTKTRNSQGCRLFQVWAVSSAILSPTEDPTEYVVMVGTKPFGFYSPYRSQTRIQTQNLDITLIVASPEGHAYNWLVCEHVGKQLNTSTELGEGRGNGKELNTSAELGEGGGNGTELKTSTKLKGEKENGKELGAGTELKGEKENRKELTQGEAEYEYIVLRKLGVLRTDVLGELLVGGQNGTSMLAQSWVYIV